MKELFEKIKAELLKHEGNEELINEIDETIIYLDGLEAAAKAETKEGKSLDAPHTLDAPADDDLVGGRPDDRH